MDNDSLLPSDQFEVTLNRLIGLPNGAHTSASVVQDTDFYGKTTQYIVQTVKTEDGNTVFLTQVNSQGQARYILPPKVLALIDRQRSSTVTQVRRRHGRRIAEERAANGQFPVITPEMRKKALETRRTKAKQKHK